MGVRNGIVGWLLDLTGSRFRHGSREASFVPAITCGFDLRRNESSSMYHIRKHKVGRGSPLRG